MRQVVRDAFVAFTAPLEGVVPWLYCDVKGLVSIGIGNLVDPIQHAMTLPLVRPDGSRATGAEIAEEWHRVKNYPGAAHLGHRITEHVTKLRLTREGIDQVVGSKLQHMDRYLASRFLCTTHDDCRANPDLGRACSYGYEQWSADAQLATLSMAWACGPAFRFPKLEAALRAQDFLTASVECFMPEEKTISGLRPRNKANRILYTNAAYSTNPDILYFPKALSKPPEPLDEAPSVTFDIVHPWHFSDEPTPDTEPES